MHIYVQLNCLVDFCCLLWWLLGASALLKSVLWWRLCKNLHDVDVWGPKPVNGAVSNQEL